MYFRMSYVVEKRAIEKRLKTFLSRLGWSDRISNLHFAPRIDITQNSVDAQSLSNALRLRGSLSVSSNEKETDDKYRPFFGRNVHNRYKKCECPYGHSHWSE